MSEIRTPEIWNCLNLGEFGFETSLCEKKCLKTKLFGNRTVIEYLKSILVQISDTHCISLRRVINVRDRYFHCWALRECKAGPKSFEKWVGNFKNESSFTFANYQQLLSKLILGTESMQIKINFPRRYIWVATKPVFFIYSSDKALGWSVEKKINLYLFPKAKNCTPGIRRW